MKQTFAIVLILLSQLAFAGGNKKKLKMVKTQVDKNVSLKLPEEFAVMSDNDIAKKYPAYRKPVATYTNEDRMIDFGFNVSNNRWGNNIGLLKTFYKATIMNMYDKVEWFQDTIVTHKKRNFIAFEFVSENINKETDRQLPPISYYHYVMYTLVKNEVYIFNYTVPIRQKDTWQPVGHLIMNSIKIGTTPNPHEQIIIKKDRSVQKGEPTVAPIDPKAAPQKSKKQ